MDRTITEFRLAGAAKEFRHIKEKTKAYNLENEEQKLDAIFGLQKQQAVFRVRLDGETKSNPARRSLGAYESR